MSTPIAYKKGYPFEKNSLAVSIVQDRVPTSADIKNPQTGGYIQINTIWTDKSTNASYIYTSAGNWAGITDAATGNVDGPASATDNALVRFDGTTGKLIQNSVGILTDAGSLSGIAATLKAGTATAGTAPLKFTAGTNLTAPEAGAVEYDGTILSYTDGTATRRPIVTGPASAVDNAITRFDGVTGKILQSSVGVIGDTGIVTGLTSIGLGIAPTSVLTLAAGTATAGTAPLKLTLGVDLTAPEAGAIEYDGAHVTFTNNAAARKTFAAGPQTSTDLALAKYTGILGEIQDSGTTLSAADVMTFPAQGGVVLTAGGANPRKGVATLVAGTVTVTTTAAVTGSVICLTIVTLGTVAAPKSMLVTITNGVNFAITSEDNTDTSTLNWAIVA